MFIPQEPYPIESGGIWFRAYTISVRMQPDALAIRRAIGTGDSPPSPRSGAQCASGARSPEGHVRLAPKLKVRRNMRYRTTQLAPYLCDGGVVLGMGVFPPAISGSIDRRTDPGDLVSPPDTKYIGAGC